MKVVILAGGLGTRLGELTHAIPKPMAEIGGMPILWHLMKYYSSFGFNDFVIALGYKQEIIKDFFCNYKLWKTDLNISTREGVINMLEKEVENWNVTLVDTGLNTQTGSRIKKLKNYLDKPFFLTYGDGLSNVNLNDLLNFHNSKDNMITITTVNPTSKYGKIDFDDSGKVLDFVEKPEFNNDWINAGFMVINPEFIDLIDEGDDVVLEQVPMKRAVQNSKLYAFRHNGFWHCMDTLRDNTELNKMWNSNSAQWKIW
ncbi:MAG: hypothetical protein RLZZ546_1862 [Bacteroidota bacterium]|jgi:glucose-1-phosphate cytidylyltransferase